MDIEINPDSLADENVTILKKNMIGYMNHQKWIKLLELFKNICFNNGIIYGGCVRDYIIRTETTKKYFNNMLKKNNIKYDEAKKYQNFNNPDIDKETYEDRNLFPNDIDIFCLENQVNKIINCIERIFVLKEITSASLRYNELFKDKLVKASIIHRRFYLMNFDKFKSIGMNIIKYLLKSMANIIINDTKIYVDLLILRKEFCEQELIGLEMYPPFGKPEFLCNMLCMKLKDNFENSYINRIPDNIIIEPLYINYIRMFINNEDNYTPIFNPLHNISRDQYILKEIINDVITKRARPVGGNIALYRCTKIISKGFKIDVQFLMSKIIYHHVEKRSDTEQIIYEHDKPCIYKKNDELNKDLICPICQDDFHNDSIIVNWGCTCNIGYHRKCLLLFISAEINKPNFDGNTSCPNCRRIVNTCLCTLGNLLIMDFYSKASKPCKDLLKCKIHGRSQFEFDIHKMYNNNLIRADNSNRNNFIYRLKIKMNPETYTALFNDQNTETEPSQT